jgi:hypothetical protein
MRDVDGLLKSTVAELDRLLTARDALGDPVARAEAVALPGTRYGSVAPGPSDETAARPASYNP